MPILPFFPDGWILERIARSIGQSPVRLVLRGGGSYTPPGSAPVATIVIRDRATLARLALDPEIEFGDAYADGRIEIEGDLVRLIEAVYELRPYPANWISRLTSLWMRLIQANTLRGSRQNIHRHYDIGNDFYRLWLDRQMVYTCAYFPMRSASLEEAQSAKLDYVCRKLRLQPGETVAEAGSGWGALALHMSRQYGVKVKSFNVSHEQVAYARERAQREGLDKQVEFIEDDYRNIAGTFDVFVSVGMLEHVGRENYREFGKVIHRAIGDSGRGLLHFIGRNYPAEFSRWIRKRVFPGAYIPTLREAVQILEPWNYSVLDAENLRLHYAKTLEHWLDRFDGCAPQVAARYDTRFVRTWRLYLAGSLAAFRTGRLQLFQVVFQGCRARPIAWTREQLYQPAPEVEKTAWIPAMS